MNIIEKIKSSVETATNLPFYYDTAQTLNTRLDGEMQLPCVMLHIVESGAVSDTNSIIRERLTLQLLFCDLSNLDFDGLDVEGANMDKLKRAAFAWLGTLWGSHDLRLVSINGTQRYYASTDAIVCAFGVDVTIEEVGGFSGCV